MIFYCYRFIIVKLDDIDFVDLFSEIVKIINNEDEFIMFGIWFFFDFIIV